MLIAATLGIVNYFYFVNFYIASMIGAYFKKLRTVLAIKNYIIQNQFLSVQFYQKEKKKISYQFRRNIWDLVKGKEW